jgi:calcineurin-like phosphoesterase family protein
MRRWFTADLHLGHARIIDLCNRPFADVYEMNNAIIENWNACVAEEDAVFVAGDVALGRIDESLSLVHRLNGQKFLVPGNHDRCWSGNKPFSELNIQRYFSVGFYLVGDEIFWPSYEGIANRPIRLCHFPYIGDSRDEEDRFASYRPQATSNDEWLLHGHVHNKWKVNGNMINVGVDVWDFSPVSEDTIREIIFSSVRRYDSRNYKVQDTMTSRGGPESPFLPPV